MNCKSMSNVFYSSSIVIIEKRAKVEGMKKNITFLRQKFGTLEKSRTFASRLRNNATKVQGSLGEWLKPPVC